MGCFPGILPTPVAIYPDRRRRFIVLDLAELGDNLAYVPSSVKHRCQPHLEG